MCTAVVHFSPRAARSSAAMPHSFTSSMKTLKAGSSNWIDVDAGGLELQRLLVEDLGKRHRHVGAPAEMRVGERVADGHRAGQGEFQAFFVCDRQNAASSRCTGRLRFGLPVTVGTSTT